MGRTQMRIWGDPFRASERARSLRELLDLGTAEGLVVGLCLTGVEGDGPADPGRAVVETTDGTRTRAVATSLDPASIARIGASADRAVADTAALVVFGDHDDLLLAALEFPCASQVVHADPGNPRAIVDAVVGFAAAWPGHASRDLVDEAVLAPFRALPYATGRERGLFCACGPDTDLGALVTTLGGAADGVGPTLRVQGAAPDQRRWLERRLGARVAFVEGVLTPELLEGALAIVQPSKAPLSPEFVAIAMSSGRPLVTSRVGPLVCDVVEPGFGVPLGGRHTESGFATDPRSSARAVEILCAEPGRAPAIARRARERSARLLAGPRPSPPPAELRANSHRPLVVLEAPLFETSSSAHLTIETARALVVRDRVDVLLRPRVPFRSGLDVFAGRAPELVGRLTRRPPRADLWLSAGWPVRASRGDATMFALRIDYEYGALPTELTPHVTDVADRVVVHSTAVRRLVAAAGVPTERIAEIPHGVDGEVFSEHGPSSAAIDTFANGRRVVLFVGGPIWRKGFDLVVATMLRDFHRNDDVCLVVKSVGRASDYSGFELGDLLERMHRLPTAVDVLHLDDELEPAELAAVYRSAHVLLHPYRGEGFCLPVLEARACGLPVVTTSGGSTDDFCAGGGVVRIPSRRRPVGLPDPHEGPAFVLEPESESIGALVRHALAREVRNDALREAAVVRDEFGWDRAAARIESLAFEAFVAAPAGARLNA